MTFVMLKKLWEIFWHFQGFSKPQATAMASVKVAVRVRPFNKR